MLDTLFTASSVYYFPFPSERLLLSCSKPGGVSGHKEKEQLGQRSDVLPFRLWPCSVCWALSPFPAHVLSLCKNPQSHPGCAHEISSCPPHRSDCSRAPVIRKALYRLKTQTPSTGHGGAELLFPSVKHPGLVGPCLVGVSETPTLRVTGMSWEEHSSSVSSVGPAALERDGTSMRNRERGPRLRTGQLVLLSKCDPPSNIPRVPELRCAQAGPLPSSLPTEGPCSWTPFPHPSRAPVEHLRAEPPLLPTLCSEDLPATQPQAQRGPPSLGGVDLGLSLPEGRAAWTQLHSVPWWESL